MSVTAGLWPAAVDSQPLDLGVQCCWQTTEGLFITALGNGNEHYPGQHTMNAESERSTEKI